VPILETLAKDPDWYVRAAVAGHPSTPVPVLETLAKDPGWYVRAAVADSMKRRGYKQVWNRSE